MPNLATGTNVYRPSDGTQGAASATLSYGKEPEDNTRHRLPINRDTVDSDEVIGDAEPSHLESSPPPPPSSPPPSPSLPKDNVLPVLGVLRASHTSTSYPSATGTTSTSSMSTAAKRKQSALHSSQQSNPSGIKKQRTTTGAVALNGIKESLDAFNDTLGSLVMHPERGRADTSPERRAKAMDVLQELEDYLDDDRMVAFIDLFRADTAAADAYLAIKRDSLRKKWVEKQLVDTLGFPAFQAPM